MARQLLTESVLLSLLGGMGGVFLAIWSIEGLQRLHPQALPQFSQLQPDYRVLVFAVAVALFTGILSGFAPAVFVLRAGLNDTLKEGARTRADTRNVRHMRMLLVGSEIALAMVLLVGSGLLSKFRRIAARRSGIRPPGLADPAGFLAGIKVRERHAAARLFR